MPRVNLIQLRGGTAAAWTAANPVLDAREPGLETDTRKIKYGDGSTAWNSLSYSNGDQKQDAMVSGTNIKTINGSSVLGSGDLAVTAAPLTVIAGTNAAVTMTVNRHYELDASILTADRNYTLPTPTATGDRIRVSLTSGNATYECIIKGNTGITVNGGSAGAEWSRLFIAREYAEFRATDATNWDVWDDGRDYESIELFGIATTAFVNAAFTRFTLGGSTGLSSLAGTNEIVVRRSGIYSVSGYCNFQPSGGSERTLHIQANHAPGAALDTALLVRPDTVFSSVATTRVTTVKHRVPVDVGNAITVFYYTDGTSGTNQYLTQTFNRPSLEVVRIA